MLISADRICWLVILWGMVMVIPYLFCKSVEKVEAYCQRHKARLTTRGVEAIATFYLIIFTVYTYTYMVKFLDF